MGIKGLNNFITKFDNGILEKINMPKEIEEWRTQNNGKNPTILIDLKETVHIFMQQRELTVALGGSFEYYNRGLKYFIENLRKTNANLVFFMAGGKYTDGLQFFIPAREYAYISCLDVLDKFEGFSNVKELTDAIRNNKYKTFGCEFRMISPFEYNVERLVRRYGDFHVNYIQHNQEIAQYAKQHADNVLAIITNDTDFMGFEGDFQFWRANGLHAKNMSCMRYSRHKLCERIGLNFHQLQLLSALCGSRYLPMFVITDFLNGLVSANDDQIKFGKIWNLTSYIKRQPFEMINNKPKYDLERICVDIFGMAYNSAQLNCIANGMKIYELDLIDEPEPNNLFLKFCKQRNMFLYKLATDDIFNVKDIEYIDFRNYKSKSYAELIVPILEKMCGILYKDQTDRPDVRKICMKHAHDEPFKVTEETIIYPPMELPELFDLIFKRREKCSDELHWSLLEWILDLDKDFVNKLRKEDLSRTLSAVIITLKYLVQNEELTAYESNAILITEYKIQRFGSNNIQLQNVPSTHSMRIAHLYVKIYVLVSHCLEICGLRDVTNLIRFEGMLFQNVLDELQTNYEQHKQQLDSIGLDFFDK